jgi:hypothetical protein
MRVWRASRAMNAAPLRRWCEKDKGRLLLERIEHVGVPSSPAGITGCGCFCLHE